MEKGSSTLKMEASMKAPFNMESLKAKEDIFLTMDVSMKAKLEKVRLTGTDLTSTVSKIMSIMVTGKMIFPTEKVDKVSKMVVTMKEIFKMAIKMDMEDGFLTQGFMKATFKMETLTEKGNLGMLTIKCIMGYGKTDTFKVMEFLPGRMGTDMKDNIELV